MPPIYQLGGVRNPPEWPFVLGAFFTSNKNNFETFENSLKRQSSGAGLLDSQPASPFLGPDYLSGEPTRSTDKAIDASKVNFKTENKF